MDKMILCGMVPGELLGVFQNDGLTLRHEMRILNNLYKKGTLASGNQNQVPLRIIDKISSGMISGLYPPVSEEVSSDGTVKYLFVNSVGQKFETVYLTDGKRKTVCVSSQSGCRMGCNFCVTGRYGFHGNLTASDILNQVLSIPPSTYITHVVFMGMGEPMDNLDNVMKASYILTAEWGRALSPGNITVSTVGITPSVIKFLDESECNLAVSLFSPFTEERKKIVPVENKYPVEEILAILKNVRLSKKRRLTLSYVMICGLNDSDRHLSGLKGLLSGSGIRINLIPYHTIPNDGHVSSSAERMQLFKHSLVTSGISASIRKSRGSDISAACGLLASGFSR